jgi:hypothetical protein
MGWWLFLLWPVAAFAVLALFHGAQRRHRRERTRGLL